MGRNRRLLVFKILLVLFSLSVPYTAAQTTGTYSTGTEATVVTEVITVTEALGDDAVETTEAPAEITEPPPDPCASNPCKGTANSECVASDKSYSCVCLKGYSLSDGVCSGEQTFSSEMVITTIGGSAAVYTEALGDPTSAEFIAMAADVEDMVDTVYRASTLASIYKGCHVNSFSSGSLSVDYSVTFAREVSDGGDSVPVSINTTSITNAFTTALTEQVDAGTITMVVDPASIVVTDYNECLSPDDNYCDTNANCTNILGSFSCECREDYIDVSPGLPSNPGRVCDDAPTMAPNLACLSNPCTDTTRVCVPNETSSTGYSCECKPGYRADSYWSCSPIERATNFRCYSCHDSYDINDCNGRMTSENGSYEWCPNPTDTCYTTIQMNPEGDGWMIRKGCMDKEECYDILYGYRSDPEKDSCYTKIWPYGPNTGPKGGLQCHYCCNERWGLDLCNKGSTAVLYTVPFINNWDPRMKWDLTLDWDVPTESGAARLSAIGPLGILVTLVLAYVLHH